MKGRLGACSRNNLMQQLTFVSVSYKYVFVCLLSACAAAGSHLEEPDYGRLLSGTRRVGSQRPLSAGKKTKNAKS